MQSDGASDCAPYHSPGVCALKMGGATGRAPQSARPPAVLRCWPRSPDRPPGWVCPSSVLCTWMWLEAVLCSQKGSLPGPPTGYAVQLVRPAAWVLYLGYRALSNQQGCRLSSTARGKEQGVTKCWYPRLPMDTAPAHWLGGPLAVLHN